MCFEGRLTSIIDGKGSNRELHWFVPLPRATQTLKYLIRLQQNPTKQKAAEVIKTKINPFKLSDQLCDKCPLSLTMQQERGLPLKTAQDGSRRVVGWLKVRTVRRMVITADRECWPAADSQHMPLTCGVTVTYTLGAVFLGNVTVITAVKGSRSNVVGWLLGAWCRIVLTYMLVL